MPKYLSQILAVITLLTAWFIVLFDPTALALGLKVFTAVPNFMLVVAEMLGSLAWLHGMVMSFTAALLLGIAFYEDIFENVIKKSVMVQLEKDPENISAHTLEAEDEKLGLLFKKTNLWKNITTGHAVILTLTAIASGFWFTGSAWLIAIISAYIYRHVGIELAKEIIEKEKQKLQDEKS